MVCIYTDYWKELPPRFKQSKSLRFNYLMSLIMGERFSVSGVVKDSAGNLLSDVVVNIGSKSTVTSNDGVFKVTGLCNGVYNLTATKSGYSYTGKSITIQDASITGEVIVMSFTGYNYKGTVTDGHNPISGVVVNVSN